MSVKDSDNILSGASVLHAFVNDYRASLITVFLPDVSVG
jgi:hypothetical protein